MDKLEKAGRELAKEIYIKAILDGMIRKIPILPNFIQKASLKRPKSRILRLKAIPCKN